MASNKPNPARRRFLQQCAALGAGAWLGPAASAPAGIHTRTIPSSGERISAIGMGTWQTFDVTGDRYAVAERARVLQTFLELGGGMVDSSPMYGSSERVIGECLTLLDEEVPVERLFAATKVWTPGQWLGRRQMEDSLQLWGLARFDLMQVHNLLDWEAHLETLKAWKAEGRIRYLGITTSHGRRHDELAAIMQQEPLDFVQFTYNLLDREAEQRLLPLAAERGIAVIVNRPFQHAGLFHHVRGLALPAWAAEIDCANWAQFFLKFIISHPAVTCAIPATSRVDHMRENMGALHGRLPDAAMRRRMIAHMEAI
jgi:diketogulonate reductase-like aldo/keto reductase